MTERTYTLSIRLIEEDFEPDDAVRDGVSLSNWTAFEGSKITTGKVGGKAPPWTDLLEFSESESKGLAQYFSFGLIFLKTKNRWFTISFGHGHTKLKPETICQDFGLRVVLNSVVHNRLRSADLRTPDSNTLSRRAQTSRRSDRSAFDIDPERDIVRGLMGEPKDKKFATRVSGADALSIRRKCSLADLPAICAAAYDYSKKSDYKTHFGWIDQIKHVRDEDTLEKLNYNLVTEFNAALAEDPEDVDSIALALPDIYDPDKGSGVRFYGYRSQNHFPDLEIANYLQDLASRSVTSLTQEDLRKHSVRQCDDDGKPEGQPVRLFDCIVFETELDGEPYTLSAGRWYAIDKDLAKEVEKYFATVSHFDLPPAVAGDNEQTYNKRVAKDEEDYFSLDAKTIKPSDATSPIEVCDFLRSDGKLIHIKNKAESSQLSHLFNQGMVSAIVLKRDGEFRDRVRTKIGDLGGDTATQGLIEASSEEFDQVKHPVVFGVIVNPGKDPPKLPFFSLISFRHACRRIKDELGYPVLFSWIEKPSSGKAKKVKRRKKKGS